MVDPAIRKFARDLVQVNRRLHHLETVPQLDNSSLDNQGMGVYDEDGNLTVTLGKQKDGTWGAYPVGGPIPPGPLGLSFIGGPGLITVSWEGRYDKEPAPLDFDALEVLVDGTLSGSFSNRDGGTFTVTAEEGTHYVSARVRTLVPRHSSTTSPVGVDVGPPADQLFIDARAEIEAAEGEIEAAKDLIAQETVDREAALQQAASDLAELDGKLAGMPQSADLDVIRGDLADAQAAVEQAQADATSAKGAAASAASEAATAKTAADNAEANALAAIGVAADKGRIFYQATAPTGDDRNSNNLWIDSDNGKIFIWDGSVWTESESEDLRDAAMAAVAAQQAAEAADQKAQDAASAAAAAGAKADAAQGAADAAQGAAEAAQTTADQATLDAVSAHNEAVAAQDKVDAAIESGDSLIINGSFESGALGWPAYLGDNTHSRAGIIEDPDARTGTHTLRLTPVDANIYPESEPLLAVTPGQVLNFRGWWKHLGGDGTQTRMLVRTHDAAKAYVGIRYPSARSDVQEWPVDEWILQEGDYVVEEGIRFLSFAPHATGASTSEYRVDDLQVIDVTDARAAQAAAQEAHELAESKPDMAEVETAITVSANGKNAITVSSAAASSSTPGVVVGDTWWRVDGSGQIFGQWRWTGSAWSAVTIRSEVIANLDVGKLVVTGSSRFTEAVVDRLFADIFTAHKITASEITIAAIGSDGNLAPDSVGAVTIKDGAVGADQIIAEEVAAEVSNLVRANVEKLVVTDGATINEAVILKLATEMITAGAIRTAETGQRVVINESGIVMYGVDSDGNDFELVRIGPSGDNLITAGDTTISPAGVQAQSGDFEQITIGGQTLLEYMDPAPTGVVARGWNDVSGRTIGPNGETELGEMYVPVVPGRGYQISVEPISAYVPRGGRLGLNIYVEAGTDDSPAKSPSLKTSRLYRGIVYRDSGGDRPLVVFQGQHYAWPSEETHWRLLFTFNAYASTDVGTVYAASDWASGVLRASVTDVGLHQEFTMIDRKGRTSTEPTPPEPTPPPVKKRYTKTYSSTGYRTYDNNGNSTSDPDVVQGLYAGGPSSRLRKGGWTFPSMTGDLSGAAVEKVRVKLYVDHTYYTAGATVNVCTWGGVLRDNLTVVKTYTGWKRGTSKWITLPASTHAGFKSGAIDGVGVKPTNTFAEQFARLATGAKIEITYVN